MSRDQGQSRRWKLLKDLPGYVAGIEVKVDAQGTFWRWDEEDKWSQLKEPALLLHLFKYNSPGNLPDFFAPLPMDTEAEGRWRADRQANYWYVNFMGKIEKTADDYGEIDDEAYNVGNYFRTEAQAQAAAEAIRKLLAVIHTPQNTPPGMLEATFPQWEEFLEAMQKSRDATRNGGVA